MNRTYKTFRQTRQAQRRLTKLKDEKNPGLHASKLRTAEFIASRIEELEKDRSLFIGTNFEARADALDVIEFHIISRIDALLEESPIEPFLGLEARAKELRRRLQLSDTVLFEELRETLRREPVKQTLFKDLIVKYIRAAEEEDQTGYTNLDLFLNGLLGQTRVPDPVLPQEPEMVFYQKVPARIVFEMSRQTDFHAGDVFLDIGSGLGQAVILIHLLTGINSKGIEYEPAYCDYASACASQLELNEVSFLNANATMADYSEGNLFFFYTPFEGMMLLRVLQRLEDEGRKRPIRIFTYGPCSKHISGSGRMRHLSGDPDDAFSLCLFESNFVRA